MEVRVVDNSAHVVYVVLPARPAEGELADENLTNVVGAGLALSTPCVCV